jgi:hypothetical protein
MVNQQWSGNLTRRPWRSIRAQSLIAPYFLFSKCSCGAEVTTSVNHGSTGLRCVMTAVIPMGTMKCCE